MADAASLGVLAEEPSICNGGVSQLGGGNTGGVFFPLPELGNWERQWGPRVQAAIVFTGLLYCFAGVAFIADVFMAAIEKITSQKTRVPDEHGHMRTRYVWNPTVANLTLMALGSSAPEILLSCIELVSNSMQSGELGPSTIVGSAAFNLHVIIAVCVVAIPSGETRAIKELPVFIITASFSILAYLWLVIILMFQSPDVVEWWEGLLTFLFFPVLVALAYMADKGYIHVLFRQRFEKRLDKLCLTSDSTPQEKELMALMIKRKYGAQQEVRENMEELMHYEFAPKPNRAQMRMQATRDMLKWKAPPPVTQSANYTFLGSGDPTTSNLRQQAYSTNVSSSQTASSIIEHACEHYMVKESDKKVVCEIKRTGDCSKKCKVRVRTIEGSAKAGDDFEPVNEDIWFYWHQSSKKVTIKIMEDCEYEELEDFLLKLELPSDQDSSVVRLGEKNVAKVLILDNNHPGVLKFKTTELKVVETFDTTKVQVDIVREKGTYGKVTCSYATEDITAIHGYDYVPIRGTLEFAHGEAHKMLTVDVLPKGRSHKTEQFRLIISNATGGATFDDQADGDKAVCFCTVTIEGDPEHHSWMGGMAEVVAIDSHQLALDQSTWSEQFQELRIDGPAGFVEWSLHIFLFPWKLLCAFCPPPCMCDGWACFFVALAMIGALTAVIGDLADMLGCALGIPASITAVTIVALGTSLPDMFASKSAAVQDPTADNSIGNVTGSNSVNVFLGLGLPWMIGAFYWKAVGVDMDNPHDPWMAHGRKVGWDSGVFQYPATLVVPAGSLASSVLVFSFTAACNISILMIRRRMFGGELGGSNRAKYVTAAIQVALWIGYIAFSIVQSIHEAE